MSVDDEFGMGPVGALVAFEGPRRGGVHVGVEMGHQVAPPGALVGAQVAGEKLVFLVSFLNNGDRLEIVTRTTLQT